MLLLSIHFWERNQFEILPDKNPVPNQTGVAPLKRSPTGTITPNGNKKCNVRQNPPRKFDDHSGKIGPNGTS